MNNSFEEGARGVSEIYRFELPVSALRAITLKHALRITLDQERQLEEEVGRLPARGKEVIVAQADGCFLNTVEAGRPRRGKRPRQWKEVRLCCAVAKGVNRPTYAASLEGVEETGRQWAHCAQIAGRGLNSRVHTVIDGAEWLTLQAKQRLAVGGRILLDFYHLSEYLAEAAPVCRAHAPQTWLKTQQRRLKEGRWKPVLKELSAHVEEPHLPDEEAPVRRAWRYLGNRTDQLHYDEAIDQQLPIGSGIIESGHKHVLQSRLKKPGAAWLPENLEAMAQTRAAIGNDNWDKHWNAQFAE